MGGRSEVRGGFPRRDAEGRIRTLTDLLGVTLAGLVVGLLALVLLDGLVALAGGADFGRANGWLAVILPAWYFFEEFRAWSYGAARVAAALVAVAVAVTTGLLVAGLTAELPPLVSGGLAATVFTLGYAVIWFNGVRWLANRTG